MHVLIVKRHCESTRDGRRHSIAHTDGRRHSITHTDVLLGGDKRTAVDQASQHNMYRCPLGWGQKDRRGPGDLLSVV
eukprot:365918-Chlamydomonas_euryale.AAC.2